MENQIGNITGTITAALVDALPRAIWAIHMGKILMSGMFSWTTIICWGLVLPSKELEVVKRHPFAWAQVLYFTAFVS
jgi:hypothetical protein